MASEVMAWLALTNSKTRTAPIPSEPGVRRRNDPPDRFRTRLTYCQDFPLLAQPPVLTFQPAQLLALGTGQSIDPPAGIAIGRRDPIPDRLRLVAFPKVGGLHHRYERLAA